ncbi:vitelline membrane outer layer protein 1 homolog [Mytilus californianus]|uniref:vitelline membrane outer layer protein 1 homolog n=1 Tax=Mytilus californianus TaxID=6549 RepID=UPI0022473990|nr:vitelline membrane outer layer protein 1 homolog [Mytilus californianus]
MLCYIGICFFVSVLLTTVNGVMDVEARITSVDRVSALAAQRTITKVLWVNNGGPWGTWSRPEFCAKGYFASGFSLKIEGRQGKGDDTALNAIRLKCRKGNNSPNTGGTIWAHEGRWGQWSRTMNCPSGKRFVGFRLQVEARQGKGDDTAANYFRFRCRRFNGGATHRIGTKGLWGKFGAWSQTCPRGSAVCGLKVKIERPQGKGDDTALNNAKFYCCT